MAECGQTKGIRIRSRIYYAINDHALLKSCIFFVSVSLFMFFFYGKIITDFARWSFRRRFFSSVSWIFFHLADGVRKSRKKAMNRHTAESHFGLQMW